MIVAASRAQIRWLEPQGVPPDGYYHVYRDDRDGTVVYDAGHRITPRAIAAWPDMIGRAGLGVGPLGAGPLGIGQPDGPGLGNFPLGLGLIGIGADYRQVYTPALRDGTWTFAVASYDAAGNAATPAAVTVSVALAGTPAAPTNAAAEDAAGDVKLTWTLSPDDEAA